MKITAMDYTCGKCKTTFKYPGLSELVYGEFVLISDDGEDCVYVNALESQVYNEISDLINSLFPQVDELKRDEYVQLIFPHACDRSKTNSLFRIGNSPKCPNCESREMESWDLSNPIEYHERNEVSYKHWLDLSEEEKIKLIRKIIGE